MELATVIERLGSGVQVWTAYHPKVLCQRSAPDLPCPSNSQLPSLIYEPLKSPSKWASDHGQLGEIPILDTEASQ